MRPSTLIIATFAAFAAAQHHHAEAAGPTSIVAINIGRPSPSPESPGADFSCNTCRTRFSECAIACLINDLSWPTIFGCQATCKQDLCNGDIGKV